MVEKELFVKDIYNEVLKLTFKTFGDATCTINEWKFTALREQ